MSRRSRLPEEPASLRVGIDENGLGARLGPLVVTSVTARVGAPGRAALARPLPASIAADLDDSKRLVAHGDVALAEAWARALVPSAATPAELFGALSLEGEAELRSECPSAAAPQCWHVASERFVAPAALSARVAGHLAALAALGIAVTEARSSVVCVRRLNGARDRGVNRFAADLHAMERLTLAARERHGAPVDVVCGKVGGIRAYGRCFGPLSGRLHVVVEEEPGLSAYRFPGLGELRFVRDADAADPLVMVASLVGKWVREVLMARIAEFHHHALGAPSRRSPSGYHDPITAAFVRETREGRARAGIPDACFERAGRAADEERARG